MGENGDQDLEEVRKQEDGARWEYMDPPSLSRPADPEAFLAPFVDFLKTHGEEPHSFVMRALAEHPLVIMFYFPLVCLPLAGLWSVFNWVQPQGSEWLFLLLMGLTTQAGQYFMTRSYQVAVISKVAIVNYTEVLFAIVLGIVLFAENFNLLTYAGMGLVVAGVVLNIAFKPKAVPVEALTP